MIATQFEIRYQQVLNEAGELVNDLPSSAQDNKTLLELYRLMQLTRAFDTKAVNLQRTGKMGTYASTLGQEAIGTAIGYAMQTDDILCPYYRDYAAMMQRGVMLSEILTYWGGSELGSRYQKSSAHDDFPICVPIATQSLHATGIGFALKFRKQARAVVTTIGEGGTSKGDFYEALNVAGAWQLPVVFVVNNNQWAISVSRDIQTHTQTIAQKAIAAGIEGLQVDGNDVIATHDVIAQALQKARNGEGPTMIEAISYRLCDHTTADDATRYRPDTQVDEAWQREPILRLRNYLVAQNLWDDNKEQDLLAECKKEVDQAVKDYTASMKEKPTAMFDHLYAELPAAYVDQYAELIERGL